MATAFPSDDDDELHVYTAGLQSEESEQTNRYPLRIFDDSNTSNNVSDEANAGRNNERVRGRGQFRRPRSTQRLHEDAGVEKGRNDFNSNTRPRRGQSSSGRRGGRGSTRGVFNHTHTSYINRDGERMDEEISVERKLSRDRHRGSSTPNRGQRGRHNSSDQNIDVRNRNDDDSIQANELRNVRMHGNIEGTSFTNKRKLAFNKLVSLAKYRNPDELLLQIAPIKSGFAELLDDEIQPDYVYHILKILSTVINSSQKASLIPVLVKVEGSFLVKLNATLGEISLKTESYSRLWGSTKSLTNVCSMILKVLDGLLQTIHSSMGKCKSTLTIVKEITTEFNLFENNESLQTEVISFEESIKALREEKASSVQSKRDQQRKRHNEKEEEGQPPENFRDLSVLPAVRDVKMDEKPFLRANRTKGKYEDLDTYLDIQFRLLREDFMQPLRTGISEYIQSLSNDNNNHRLRDIRLYKNVQIMRPVCIRESINHIIQFDMSALKRVNLAASRRLLYGSLLCLSSDNFQTIYYATVKDRNIKNLDEGLLCVCFETVPDTGETETFVMAESSTYFEAYRHILSGLQSIDSSIPFQRYIVECNTTIKPPSYLLKGGVSVYDFNPVLPSKKENAGFKEIPVLNTTRWPQAADLGLDKTQFEALQLALTKEMSIIQGPPGTGKTFIGLKIAKLLIANKNYWKPNKMGSPILVVCLTNHALDQFLEGMLTFSKDGIVRVGGMCINEALEPFVLRNVKRRRSQEKQRKWGILQLEKDCLRSMSSSQQEIHKVSSELKKTHTELIHYEILQSQMTIEQQDEFENTFVDEEKKNYIRVWLEFRPSHIKSKHDIDELEATKEEIAKTIWTSHVMENVTEMPSVERSVIDDPVVITLQERAMLYKAWLAEFTSVVERLAYLAEDKNRRQFDRLLAVSKTEIVAPRRMLDYIQSNTTKTQIKTLLSRIQFETWLAVDGSTNAMAEIKTALAEHIEVDTEEKTFDDMEEERELDSDNDESIWGYNDEDWTRSKLAGKSSTEGEQDWVLQWNAKKERTQVRKILNSARAITDYEAESKVNVCRLGISERKNLYRYWIVKYREHLKQTVKEFEKQFVDIAEQLREVREAETYEILQKANVIGMTTTGAAKHREALQRVKPSIVIVEEAAEVLESHIITALSDGCKHLILIGDHKQLRPSTTVYELSKQFQLDISLFERLINNGFPCVTLEEQHRMRPEISILLRNEFLYPNLRDHKVVFSYDKVRGIDSDVFFIDHEHSEVRSEDSTSYHNPHEASFLACLCRYLLQQGYDRTQITVLSPYMGQVSLIRKAMPKNEFEGVRVTAVDNYQGEENDIILLSLVRNDGGNDAQSLGKKNPIGFLAIENRICVALSRAKMGFYVIGNFSLLQRHSRLWYYMVQTMTKTKRVAKEITLRCENHQQNTIKASTKEDFNKAPDGGCREPCGGELACGHACPRVCHIQDRDHKHVKCLKPCTKVFAKCNHRCMKKCFQDCGKCQVKVQKQLPTCIHSAKMPCYIDPYSWSCSENCGVKLPCGHDCTRSCNICVKTKTHETKCQTNVSKKLPCGHTMELHCFQDPQKVICAEPCSTTLLCGHPCNGSCGSCLRGKIHKLCVKTCRKVLPCGHKCSSRCSDLCPPCTLPCEWICSHGTKCGKKCSEECDKCFEECSFKCFHSKCTKLCHELCDKKLCNEKCRKIVECGHPCTGICTESCICSEFCTEKGNKYKDIYEEGTLYIRIVKCGCIVPQSLLDIQMSTTTNTRNNTILRCPDCKKPVGSLNRRYSNALKVQKINILEKFRVIRGSQEEKDLKRRSLLLQIKKLGIYYPEEGYLPALQERLKMDTFGTLHILDKCVELLKELLPACKTLKSLQDTTLVIAPEQIKELITRRYKYSTTQLWLELEREVKRIVYYVELKSIQRNAGVQSGTVQEDILLRAINFLEKDAPIGDKEREVITKVIARFK